MNTPVLSIITVVYNAEATIERTIKSIIKYKSVYTEYIVIDGGSTDTTVKIINDYLSFIDFFTSEPDNGIYDAMNKAMQYCRGRYILNINAGDILIADPMTFLTDEILSYAPDLILFDVLLSNDEIFRSNISWISRIKNTIHHQGAMYRKGDHLIYDLKYKVFSDFNLNLKIIKKDNFKFLKLNQIICKHDLGGVSHVKRYFNENYSIIWENFSVYHLILSFLYHKYCGIKAKVQILIKSFRTLIHRRIS